MKGDNLNRDHFEKELKKAADNFEMQPSKEVWNNINAQTDSSDNRMMVFWRAAAVAAGILLLFGLGWFFLTPSEKQYQGTHPAHLVVSDSSMKAKDILPEVSQKKDSQGADNFSEKNKNTQQTVAGLASVKNNPSSLSGKKRSNKLSFREFSSEKRPAPLGNKKDISHLERNQSILPISGKVASINEDGFPGIKPVLRYPKGVLMTGTFAKNDLSSSESNIHATDRKLSFGAYFTSGMSYRTLKNATTPKSRMNAMNANQGLLMAERQESPTSNNHKVGKNDLQQKPDFGWETGVRVGLPLSKKWTLESGLSVQQMSYQMTAYRSPMGRQNLSVHRYSTVPVAVSNDYYSSRFSTASPSAMLPKKVELKNQYLNMELPILIGYQFQHLNKWSVSIKAGAGLTYMLNENAVTYDEELKHYLPDEGKDHLKNFNTQLLFEVNMNIPLSRKLEMAFGPALQYQLQSSYKVQEPLSEFPYLIGFKTALSFK